MNSLLLALFLAQANMGLTIPTPGVTPGPTYATEISNDLVIIDAHNHTAGNGVQVPTAGLNINANLSFNGFGATNFNSCTGTACPSGGGLTNPLLGTFIADAGVFDLLVDYGLFNAYGGANIDGGLIVGGQMSADAGYFGNITINGTCTGPGCGGGGITNPYLGTFIADAGNFGSVTSDAGYYATLIAINGIDGTLTLDGGGISQSAASTPLTITGNAPATGSNGIIANTGPTTLTTGNIEQFQNNSVVKGSIDFAGKFLSLPGDFFASGANTATLKGAIAATGTGAIIDNTIDVTGTGYITLFSTAGTPEFAITGRGHLIPLSTAPTVGSFASGYGTVAGPTVTGGDASFKVSFTTGTATAITYGTALMVVTLNQAYSSQSLANSHAAYSSAPAAGGADQASLYAVFTAGNQITIYAGSGSSTTSFIPISAHFYAISVITMGAGASF